VQSLPGEQRLKLVAEDAPKFFLPFHPYQPSLN
jgi:hypothetical protein